MHVLLYLYHVFFMQLCLHTCRSLHTGTQRDTHTSYMCTHITTAFTVSCELDFDELPEALLSCHDYMLVLD